MEKRIKRKAIFREVKLTTIKHSFDGENCRIGGVHVFSKFKENTLANGESVFYEINIAFFMTATPRKIAIARYHGLDLMKPYKWHKNYLYYLASIGAFSILDKIFRTTDILAKNNKEKDALLSQARDVASARVKAKQALDNAPKLEDAVDNTIADNIKDATDNKPVSWCEKHLNISIKELLCIVGFMIAVSLFFTFMASRADASHSHPLNHAERGIDIYHCGHNKVIVDYKDVWRVLDLPNAVKNHLDDGWVLLGGIGGDKGNYQAMVKCGDAK